MYDNIFTAESWPDYDCWINELRKHLVVRGTAVPSNRELGIALVHGGIDVMAGKLTRSNQLGWAWDPSVCIKAALWVSDHLPQIQIQQSHWEKQIRAGTRPSFQTISIGALRSRAEIPLVETLSAILENRFHLWRFEVVRTSIFSLDILHTDEVEVWALKTAVEVVKQRTKGILEGVLA